MRAIRKLPLRYAVPFVLLFVLGMSCGVLVLKVRERRLRLVLRQWQVTGSEVAPPVFRGFNAFDTHDKGVSHTNAKDLLTSEVRVVAIGSAYPVAYAAEVCPFSDIPQPAMNQLDRDDDGMNDEWELRYGLDSYAADDAATDLDADGFTNLEEYVKRTDPTRADSHAPYAEKLRFLGIKKKLFPLVYMGVSELPGGQMVFQINTIYDGRSHFLEAGDFLEHIVVKGLVVGVGGAAPSLVVVRKGEEIVLRKGVKMDDPESPAELINILDRSSKMVTMGSLLYLCDDEYAVLGVSSNAVTVRGSKSEEVIKIVGFDDGERMAFSERSEE